MPLLSQHRLKSILCALSVVGLIPLFPARGAEPAAPLVAPKPPQRPAPKWIDLFDGKTLKGWKSTEFGGEGEVSVENGALTMGFGSNMTGITTTRKDLPKIDYEVDMLACRVDGSDFFCGTTFPVGENYLSLILGGWGGGVCGLSSLDTYDASENETTHFQLFNNGEWYRVRFRVTKNRVITWLDGQRIIDQNLKGHKLSIRLEVELSRPFGLASWQSTGAIKEIRIRKLDPSEIPYD